MKDTHGKMLDYITGYMLDRGYSPTTREIATGVGYTSTATVFNHLRDMRAEGLIDYMDECPRTITVPGYGYKKIKGRKDHGRTGNQRGAGKPGGTTLV